MRATRRSLARKGFTLIELMIVIAIIGVLAAIAVPNFREARKKANLKACFANQKCIAGALEQYNMDKNANVKLDDTIGGELVTGGYLQSKVDDPGEGKDSFKNYQSIDNGCGITCTQHGSSDGKTPGVAAAGAVGAAS